MTGSGRPGRELPAWPGALVVVAHPDDETFGLGAVIAGLASGGTAVHVLCFTHGEASTLNETGSDLRRAREAELRDAGTELGVATVTLLDYPDGGLAAIPPGELAGRVLDLAGQVKPAGVLVFDDTGVTGHTDHRAATAAAVEAAADAGLPVLAWLLPEVVAGQLRAETGQPFGGREPGEIDVSIRVDRAVQRRAALRHVSQISPGAIFWRRLDLQGGYEHLRWLLPPGPGGLEPGAWRRSANGRATSRRRGGGRR